MSAFHCGRHALWCGRLRLVLGVEAPEVDLVGVERVKIGLFEQKFTMVLRVTSTSDLEIPLDGLVVCTKLNGWHVTTSVTKDRITLPRLGATEMRIPTRIRLTDLLKAGMAVVSDAVLTYDIEGHTFYAGKIGRIKIPFSESGYASLVRWLKRPE